MIDVEPLVDWLVAGAPGAPRPDLTFQRVCDGLLAAGVPLDRGEAFVRTLHPHIAGRNFLWLPGRKVLAKLVSHPMEPWGAFELKGVDVPQDAFAPVLRPAA